MYYVLLADDDPETAQVIRFYLKKSGNYHVTWASCGVEAIKMAGKRDFDIVLLDIMLPDVDGISVCEQLRKKLDCPILFTSCIDDEETIVRALRMGGDDYLVKPFSNMILSARMESNLRRMKQIRGDKHRERRFGEYTVNTGTHILRHGITSTRLSPIEYRILIFFLDHPNEFWATDILYDLIWDQPCNGDARTVMVHIYNLRRKLEEDAENPRYIHSVRGEGYLFSLD